MQLWPVALEGFRKKVNSLLSLSLSLSIFQVVFREFIIVYDYVSYYHSDVLNG